MRLLLNHLLLPALLLSHGVAPLAKAQTTQANRRHPQAESAGRPAQKSIAVRVNGKDEFFTFTLFNQLPFPFTTYVPQAFREEHGAADEGYAVRWLHGSQTDNEHAFVHFFFSTYIKNEAEGRASVRDTAVSNGSLVVRPVQSPNRFGWSLAEYDYVRQIGDLRLMGTVALGRHARRYFTVMIQRPERYEEEFMPLVNRILHELVWKDTTRGL